MIKVNYMDMQRHVLGIQVWLVFERQEVGKENLSKPQLKKIKYIKKTLKTRVKVKHYAGK